MYQINTRCITFIDVYGQNLLISNSLLTSIKLNYMKADLGVHPSIPRGNVRSHLNRCSYILKTIVLD